MFCSEQTAIRQHLRVSGVDLHLYGDVVPCVVVNRSLGQKMDFVHLSNYLKWINNCAQL